MPTHVNWTKTSSRRWGLRVDCGPARWTSGTMCVCVFVVNPGITGLYGVVSLCLDGFHHVCLLFVRVLMLFDAFSSRRCQGGTLNGHQRRRPCCICDIDLARRCLRTFFVEALRNMIHLDRCGGFFQVWWGEVMFCVRNGSPNHSACSWTLKKQISISLYIYVLYIYIHYAWLLMLLDIDVLMVFEPSCHFW